VALVKTVTQQTMTGEAGISLIAKLALEMGHIFHPRRVDHGIDGHLDLVDPASGQHLNSTVLVQSKASDRSFQNENEQGFTYLCDQRDLAHWLGGNAPVVLVFSHPKQNKAWWVDVKAAFPDAKTRATRRIQINKGTQAFDNAAGSQLLVLGLPPSSGLYLQPPPRPETLDTNLLAITDMPDHFYLAPAAAATYQAAGELLDGVDRRVRGPFILRSGMAISFADLRQSGLNRLCAGDVEVWDTTEWATTDDIETLHTFQDLLSRTIQSSYPELRWHPDRRHVHFRATKDLKSRKVGKGPGTPGRTVFGPHKAKDGSGIAYYHHAAVRMRVRRIGVRWYSELIPDYCFTADGTNPVPYEDRLVSGIKRLERHPAVAGWVRMWGRFLRGGDDLFSPDTPIQFGELLTTDVELGIDDALWGPVPIEIADTDDAEHEPISTTELVDEDVAELLSLFDSDDMCDESSSNAVRSNRSSSSSGHNR
jgi:hypothetical protein